MKSFDDILHDAYTSKQVNPPISKKAFVNLINAIHDQREIDRKATHYLQKIFDDVMGGFYNNETLYSAIEGYLLDIFNDENQWLFYFIYDLDFGERWTEDCCSESGGTIIDISTIEKLYDFLIKNMEE